MHKKYLVLASYTYTWSLPTDPVYRDAASYQPCFRKCFRWPPCFQVSPPQSELACPVVVLVPHLVDIDAD